ncbi:hypothetical protein Nmel_002245 [Mimus melanotis]
MYTGVYGSKNFQRFYTAGSELILCEETVLKFDCL